MKTPVSASDAPPPQVQPEPEHTDSASQKPLGLPPPDEAARTHKIDLSSGSADLSDALGPLVINSDGTTSRITNWPDMTADERQRTMRIITKRNRQRLQRLKDSAKKEEL